MQQAENMAVSMDCAIQSNTAVACSTESFLRTPYPTTGLKLLLCPSRMRPDFYPDRSRPEPEIIPNPVSQVVRRCYSTRARPRDHKGRPVLSGYPWNALLRIQIAPTLLDGCIASCSHSMRVCYGCVFNNDFRHHEKCSGKSVSIPNAKHNAHTNAHRQYRM